MKRRHSLSHYFDLESTIDLTHLSDSMHSLMPLHGLIIFDEIKQLSETFRTIRIVVDRVPNQARYPIVKSAAPSLLRQSSESLAGRIAYFELPELSLKEINTDHFHNLWLREGFPRSYFVNSDVSTTRWRLKSVRNFFEQDIPQFGFGDSSKLLETKIVMI